MKSPADMQIIQIDVTNACPNICSNCTRFCGHHKKNFFMEFDFFKKAVDSLRLFPNIVGVIGGEPTLHPDFDRMAKYLASSRLTASEHLCRRPILDFTNTMHSELTKRQHNACGLWSTMGKSYYRHFETISNVFGYQILNDHKNPCKHQGLLMSRKDFGIPDEQWYNLRDNCWIQNSWSATITPKGAFFCEVAGALDMLFDGPGGWDINDPHWWQRQPKDFGDQLRWCEFCGAALDSPSRISHDTRDDVSSSLIPMLKTVNSPKLKKGLVVEHTGALTGKAFESGSAYMEGSESERVKIGQQSLLIDDLRCFSPQATIREVRSGAGEWIFVQQRKKLLPPEILKQYIFNPGCIYKFKNNWVLFNLRASALSNAEDNMTLDNIANCFAKDDRIFLSYSDLYSKKYLFELIKRWL